MIIRCSVPKSPLSASSHRSVLLIGSVRWAGVLADHPAPARPRPRARPAARRAVLARRLPGECDHGALKRSDERQSNGPGGRAGWNRLVSASRVDQADQALDQPRLNPLELPPNRMVLTAELDSERHRDAGNVSSAEDGVTARRREQRGDGIGFLVGQFAHLAPPRLVGPVEYRQRQILLVLELVIQGAARVAGLARYLLEHKVAVAVAGEAPRGRLEVCQRLRSFDRPALVGLDARGSRAAPRPRSASCRPAARCAARRDPRQLHAHHARPAPGVRARRPRVCARLSGARVSVIVRHPHNPGAAAGRIPAGG
jgi:hypothetical protein